MKIRGQILQKVKQVKYRYLKKFLDKCLSKVSGNCIHNRPTEINQSSAENVCLCGYQMEEKSWVGLICDKRINPDLAKNCDTFDPLNTKEELKEEFNSSLQTLPLAILASKFPDLAALLWVLDETQEEDEDG